MNKKIKILSIDDSRSVHAFLRECTKDIAESFTTVGNGQEAVQLLKDQLSQFDLIFLDWEMPVMDGPTTYEELKKIGLKTPVFMLTSKNDPNDIMRMLNAGVVDYIMKPFTQDIILEKIKMNLG